MDLSILIVNYNTRQLTLDCLRSVYDSETVYSYEVIVVDNASRDGSVEAIRAEYPEVVLIANQENTGFAKANNQGMAIAKGRYVLLLNSDTVVQPNTFQIMVSYMEEHPELGASGCKVILPDGSLDKACRRGFPTPSASFYYAFGFSKLFPNNPRFNQYQLGYKDPNETYPVDCLIGAFMLVREETIRQVGGWTKPFLCTEKMWIGAIASSKRGGGYIIIPPHTLFTIRELAAGASLSRSSMNFTARCGFFIGSIMFATILG